MKPLKLLGALVAAAMLTGVTNIMAYDIPVSVISDASQMKCKLSSSEICFSFFARSVFYFEQII